MSSATWTIIAIVFYVLFVIFSIISVTTFFKLNIKDVWEDISGKKALREIKEIKESEKDSKGFSKYKKINNSTDPLINRGKALNGSNDMINVAHPSRQLTLKNEDGCVITEELKNQKDVYESGHTVVLESDTSNINITEDTTLLSENINSGHINKTFKCIRKMVIIQSSERI